MDLQTVKGNCEIVTGRMTAVMHKVYTLSGRKVRLISHWSGNFYLASFFPSRIFPLPLRISIDLPPGISSDLPWMQDANECLVDLLHVQTTPFELPGLKVKEEINVFTQYNDWHWYPCCFNVEEKDNQRLYTFSTDNNK